MVEEGDLALASRFDDRGVGVGYQHDILEGYGAIQIYGFGIGVVAKVIVVELVEWAIIASLEEVRLAQIGESWPRTDYVHIFLAF